MNRAGQMALLYVFGEAEKKGERQKSDVRGLEARGQWLPNS